MTNPIISVITLIFAKKPFGNTQKKIKDITKYRKRHSTDDNVDTRGEKWLQLTEKIST
jgi:hypothetical protein